MTATTSAVFALIVGVLTACSAGSVQANSGQIAQQPSTAATPVDGCPAIGKAPDTLMSVHADYVDFVVVGRTQYVAAHQPVPQVEKTQLGGIVMTSRCSFRELNDRTGQLTPTPSDGHTAFLPPGTPVYAINGWSPACRLAAEHDGEIHVYLALQDGGTEARPAACAGGDMSLRPATTEIGKDTAMDATNLDRDEQIKNTVSAYRRAHEGFDTVLAAVPTGQWDTPSACEGWSVRDVVGHVVWGQELVRHLAHGQQYASRAGAPGAEHPGQTVGADPLASWRAAREATETALSEEALTRPAPPQFVAAHPGATLEDFLNVLMLDFLAHTWDIGHPLGIEVRLAPDLLAQSLPLARKIVIRRPGMFGPELTPPPGSDEQTRWLAFLGRST